MFFSKMDPPPPSSLSKETVGVWHGWCNMGNKEVAREAAAKGSHVNLAITFLSLRKKIPFEEAQSWFKTEVMKWVDELLERRQIFRASHILNNIKSNATDEFLKKFYETENDDLREYIGNHLIKTDQLSDEVQQLWSFFKLIRNSGDSVTEFPSLDCLNSLNEEQKAEIATTLLLKTGDPLLNKYINAETLWKCLLRTGDLLNLFKWINIRFNEEPTDGNITEQFKKFPISVNMIDMVPNPSLNVPLNVQNSIYNELSKYGIFQSSEKNDLILVLKRLKNSLSLPKLYDILSKDCAFLTVDNFINLIIEYCLEQKYFHILNVCLKNFKIPKISNELDLMIEFRSLVENFNEISLSKNIVSVSKRLSPDLVEYFKRNPEIFLSVLFFTKEVDIVNSVITCESITIDGVKVNECLVSMLKNFKVLNEIFLHFTKGRPRSNLDVYDLIFSHLKINIYEFKYLNKITDFYNDAIQNYGYYKKFNYMFYLNESRPSLVAKSFILNDFGSDRNSMERKVFKKAILNFDCNNVCASCISYLEMIGIDSSKIRVFISAAKILLDSGYCREAVLELLWSFEDESYNVQNLLEKAFLEKLETKSFLNGNDLIEIFQVYEVIVMFSRFFNIKLPDMHLKYWASRNLWLPFLLFAQIHNYPIDQVKLLIQFFKSPNMLEHLTHGTVNDLQCEEKNALIRDRDSRKYLLSKVGVRKSMDSNSQYTTHSIKSLSSFESGGSSSGSDTFEIDICNIKATLLQTLIRCHNSTDPPKALLQASQLYRNPLLAVLAMSYEPDSLVTNWLTWLSVSCELCKVFTNYETTALCAKSVTDLLENCLKNCYPRTILESFQIFMPENPLKVFMEFLCCCTTFNTSQLLQKLNTFESLLKNSRKNSVIGETDHEMTYLNNKLWIETTAIRLLSALLEYNCKSMYEQILILQSLNQLKIWKYFSCECPNFNNLLNIIEALYQSNSEVRLNISQIFDIKNNRQAIISCINELLEKQHYEVALKIAQIESLPPDLIIIKEWQNKMSDRRDSNFWLICNNNFIKYNVTADCVIDFYLDCFEKTTDLFEKFILTKFAWEWSAKYDLTCQYELEQKMWLAFLLIDEKAKNLDVFDIKSATYLYKDLIETVKLISSYEAELNKDFMNQLDRIIAFALNRNNFWVALKLQKMFNCKSTDLEILKLCYSLAEGMLMPYQLNAEQRLLLSNVSCLRGYSHRRPFLSAKFSSFSSSSHSPANSSFIQTDSLEYMNDTLAILKLLSENLHNGIEIGQNIFMNYRISINIEIPYEIIVVSTDYMKILKYALEDDCPNKIDVVHDFIMAYKWSKDEVADFISTELVNAIMSHTNSNLDSIVLWDLNVDQEFQSVLQLLQDCSLLGYKIFSFINTYYSQIEPLKSTDFFFIIELLIRAHDCFTADCNMEGISMILKKSKEIVTDLSALQEWKLMVRLLTGVRRYTEMNYVFRILNEIDQFEFVLRKGFQKDNALKVALLEYLKKYCPENKELYTKVALYFALFSEVAMLWEREAQNFINNLISISKLEMQNNKMILEEEPFILLSNNDSTRKCLNKAMENYIHATDFHLQGEKLTKATNSAKQAELIALQLAFLTEANSNATVICILDLTTNQISDLVLSKLSFEQSLIVSDAYNFYVDWATVLYEQYVVKNNSNYLEDFLKHMPLTDTLVNDISRKFIGSSNEVNEIKFMKKILNRLPSLHVKYRIASELGFTDLVEDWITSGQLVYLKDTVWKKGYKN